MVPKNLLTISYWFLLINNLFFYLKIEFYWLFFYFKILTGDSFPFYRLEETLIKLYFSCYSSKTIDGTSGTRVDDVNTPVDGL